MKTVTYQGRVDETRSDALHYGGERFPRGVGVEVSNEVAEKLAKLEDYDFQIEDKAGGSGEDD